MVSYLQVVTTVDSKDKAEKIAEKMVKNRLCACAHVWGPVKSFYWWKGKVERNEEWACIMKTTDKKYFQLERAIKENHPYEVPEILAFEIAKGFENYLVWLKEELKE